MTWKKSFFSGLNKKFILYFMLFAYVPLFIFSVFGYFMNKNIIQRVHEHSLKETSQILARSIESYLLQSNNNNHDREALITHLSYLKNHEPVSTGHIKFELISEFGDTLFSVAGSNNQNSKLNAVNQIFSTILFTPGFTTIRILMKNNWVLSVHEPVGSIYNELRNFLEEIFIANVFIGILMFIIAILLSKRITSPIHNLISAVQKMSKGDISHPISVKSKDEVRILAAEFELMRKKLSELQTNLEARIEERTIALREAQFQVSHQEKMASLGLLAAGVAHEIGNPLTGISSMAQLIKRKVEKPEFTEYLNTILQNIERIRKIVRELVDFARPASYEESWVNVNELIENAVSIVKYDRRAKHINIQQDLDAELPRLYLSPDQLLQVFINILINAVDALTAESNRITVRTIFREDNVFIYFTDTGTGIPEKNMNKIFEPFFTTKKVGKGTGLGLSVSYGIIKNINGRIEVESKEGHGSTFIIILPLEKKEPNSAK